jgi:peptidyl-tRNA hydrolase, PTH1 family
MTALPLKLVVGLGNPGSQYARTRHNAGFWVVDEWLRQQQTSASTQAKFLGSVARLTLGAQQIWVLKPSTFMNKSGESVAAFTHFYQIPSESVLVIHDELDLPNGQLRLKFGGGHGGHNGLRDLTRVMGEHYWRLRVGIDHPGSKDQVLAYVLGQPFNDQVAALEDSVGLAVKTLEDSIKGDVNAVMGQLNRR